MKLYNNMNQKLTFKLSIIGYALNCNLAFTNRNIIFNNNILDINNLNNGDKYISLLEKLI
jgi:hypothetical protein